MAFRLALGVVMIIPRRNPETGLIMVACPRSVCETVCDCLPERHNAPGCTCSPIDRPEVCPGKRAASECQAVQSILNDMDKRFKPSVDKIIQDPLRAVQRTWEDSAPARVGVRGLLDLWKAAKEYRDVLLESRQDALGRFNVDETWE